jgi:hypothetical protein
MMHDWIHLPPESEPVSLWPVLHDAELTSVRSSRLERWALLDFLIPHLEEGPEHQGGFTVRFRFSDVRSVRVLTFVRWPGSAPVTAGKSPEEQDRLASEYQAKGREESMAWAELEQSAGATGFLVLQGCLTSGPGETTLRVEGLLDDDLWCVLFVRADLLSVSGADGSSLSLEGLLELGNRYWREQGG